MRIISGKYKNRELLSPNSTKTHPMGDRERLAVFNMLTSRLPDSTFEGKSVLDLFAGTGALGLEALSRGAASATFVENESKALTVLKKNLAGVSEPVEILKKNVYSFTPEKNYDIIFLDPPYDKFDVKVLEFKRFLNKNGLLVLSYPKSVDLGLDSRAFAGCRISVIVV